MNWTHTTCKVVRTHRHWSTGYRFSSKHTYSCTNNRALVEWGQAGSAREGISITTMLEFAESGTTVLLSELTTLVRTSSSEASMEFRLCTAPGIPVGKTQNYVIRYLRNSLDLQHVSTSRKELFGFHNMVTERGPRQGQNSPVEALKH